MNTLIPNGILILGYFIVLSLYANSAKSSRSEIILLEGEMPNDWVYWFKYGFKKTGFFVAGVIFATLILYRA
jgi:hypothetical protein